MPAAKGQSVMRQQIRVSTGRQIATAAAAILAMTLALIIGKAYEATFGSYVILAVFAFIAFALAIAIIAPIYRLVQWLVRQLAPPTDT